MHFSSLTTILFCKFELHSNSIFSSTETSLNLSEYLSVHSNQTLAGLLIGVGRAFYVSEIDSHFLRHPPLRIERTELGLLL